MAALVIVPEKGDTTVLKNAWYLITHADFVHSATDFPRLPQASELMVTLDDLFGAEAGFSPAQTATAVEVMLRLADHLSDAIPLGYRHAVADADQFARLLNGVNLLLAYLAQISGRLAHQVDAATGADLSGLSATDHSELIKALVAAVCRLEESAGLFKEAHLATGSAVRR